MAPKSRKEIQRQYRLRKKANDDYLENERKRSMLRRINKTNDAIVKERKQCAIRAKMFRERKKSDASKPVEREEPYIRRSSLTRAVHQVEQHLPSSPSKKKIVVVKLAKKYGLALADKEIKRSAESNNVNKVVNFF